MDELARLKELISRHSGEGVTRTALPGVSVLRAPRATEPLGDVVEPTFGVIAQGIKQTTLNGHTFTYGPGQFLIVSVELPLVGHIAQASADEPLLAFVFELRPDKIAALLLETAPAATARPSGRDATPAAIAVSDASPALLDAIARLLALLDSPGGRGRAGCRCRARDPVAAGHRSAGSDRTADRVGGQPAHAAGPCYPVDPRPL